MATAVATIAMRAGGRRVTGLSARRFCAPAGPKPPMSGKQFAKTSLHVLSWLGMGGLVGWAIAEFGSGGDPVATLGGAAIDDLADRQAAITDRVYLDVVFNDEPVEATHRIVIGLYGDVCPKTTENFCALCTGDRKSAAGRPLAFAGSAFHRVIPGFMLQAGDFTSGDGAGGESIYGARFPDESFALRHTGVGVVSMANRGPNTNSSQFFICVAATPWLDGRHVVFGQVLYGLPVLRRIEAMGSKSGKLSGSVRIAQCGVLPKLEDSAAMQEDGSSLDETGRSSVRIMK